MEKLSIREASERFGISRARLYQLLNKGVITGHLSTKRGGAGNSWVYLDSLHTYFIDNNKGTSGRPSVESEEGEYISVRDACQRTGYTNPHIYRLIKQGSIASRKSKKNGTLIFYPDLLNYKRKVFFDQM
jgi:excisionase family DNA binding protein